MNNSGKHITRKHFELHVNIYVRQYEHTLYMRSEQIQIIYFRESCYTGQDLKSCFTLCHMPDDLNP